MAVFGINRGDLYSSAFSAPTCSRGWSDRRRRLRSSLVPVNKTLRDSYHYAFTPSLVWYPRSDPSADHGRDFYRKRRKSRISPQPENRAEIGSVGRMFRLGSSSTSPRVLALLTTHLLRRRSRHQLVYGTHSPISLLQAEKRIKHTHDQSRTTQPRSLGCVLTDCPPTPHSPRSSQWRSVFRKNCASLTNPFGEPPKQRLNAAPSRHGRTVHTSVCRLSSAFRERRTFNATEYVLCTHHVLRMDAGWMIPHHRLVAERSRRFKVF